MTFLAGVSAKTVRSYRQAFNTYQRVLSKPSASCLAAYPNGANALPTKDALKDFSFLYRTKLENSIVEHEFDHVFIGEFDGVPILNAEEGEDWAWTQIETLQRCVRENPDQYSFWLKLVLNRVADAYITNSSGISHMGSSQGAQLAPHGHSVGAGTE